MIRIQIAFSHGFKNPMLNARAMTQVALAYTTTVSAETAIGHTVTLRIAIIAEYIQSTEPRVTADGAIHNTIVTMAFASALQFIAKDAGKVPPNHIAAMQTMPQTCA
jgi:hypothetical protein